MKKWFIYNKKADFKAVAAAHHIDQVRYTDTAGIRQLQFINEISEEEVLNEYYG